MDLTLINNRITNFYTNTARYLAILNRYQKPLKASVVSVFAAISCAKQIVHITGWVERDLSRVSTAKIGFIKDPNYSVEALLRRLRIYRFLHSCNVFTGRDSNTLSRISLAIDNLETDVSNGSLRKQPFCIVLYGYPGTGKSSFAIQIARALMIDKYGRFRSSDMVTLNETDEYQSEFRTSHKVVLFDDIGASRYGLSDTKNPWRKVVDFVNNIRKTALNPNVEMKGKVYIEPDLVIITSNLDFTRGAAINQYIPAQDAIFRRFNRIVRVTNHKQVTPIYRIQEEQKKLTEGYMSNTPLYGEVKEGVPGDGTPSVLQPREQYVAELIPAFREHERSQSRFVGRFNAYFDDYPDFSPEETQDSLVAESRVVRDGFMLDNYYGSTSSCQNPLGSTESHKCVIQTYTTTLPTVPEGYDDSRFFMTLAYYLRKVDWERYHLDALHWGDVAMQMSERGVVFPTRMSPETYLELDRQVFRIAYGIVLARHHAQSVHLVAESRRSNQVMTDELARDLCGRLGTTLGTSDDRRLDNIPLELIPAANSLLKHPLSPREMAPRVYAIFLAYASFRLGRHPISVSGDQCWIRHIPKFNGRKLEKVVIREGYVLSVILWEHLCRGEEFLNTEILSD